MENKLIPLTEFVNRIDELVPAKDYEMDYDTNSSQLNAIKRYAKFLSQPLTLSMVVPCDDEGNVFEEPESYGWIQNCGSRDSYLTEDDCIECEKYHEAKSKVLFEGFEVIGSDDDGVEIEMTDNNIWIIYLSTSINIQHYNGMEWEVKTVEEVFEFLKEYGLQATLSATALKQIYG